jgi:hypothetical protein
MKSGCDRIATSAGIVVATLRPASRQCPQHAHAGGLAVSTPRDELADEVVVVLAHLVTRRVAGVESCAEAVGNDELRDAPGRRQEPTAGRVLRVDADLDRVAAPYDRLLIERQRHA